MPAIELVTFDLDNTLWDVEAVIGRAEAAMVDWIGANAPAALEAYRPATVADIREAVVREHPGARHDLSFLRTEILERVMRHAGYSPGRARDLAEGAFAVFYAGRNAVEFFPGALDLLDRLKDRYVLYALTNGNADIARTGLDRYLAGAISAADVGASKPDTRMFEAVLGSVGCRPGEAAHVGDHLVDDIAGAASAGMHTVWVNLRGADPGDATHPPTETVTDLSGVAHAVARIERRRA